MGALVTPTGASAASAPTVALSGEAPAAAEQQLTLSASHASVRKNEAVWVAGRLTIEGAVAAGRKILIQVRPHDGARWATSAHARTRADGRFTTSLRISGDVSVRARAAATGQAPAVSSAPRDIVTAAGDRTLGARQKALGKRAGAFASSTVRLTKKQRAATRLSGVVSVRHRNVARGLLVETRVRTGSGTATRTWLVRGKILKAYRAAGGPRGSLGVPVGDARCGLSADGCVQRFSRGVLYESSSKKRATSSSVRGARGEVFAAARSQLGYAKRTPNPEVQSSKFNRWMGSSKPWCSFFVSWAFDASGHRRTVPQSASFSSFRAEVRKTMKTGRTPRVGALAFLDTRPPVGDNHVAIVIARSGPNVTIIEGNMGSGWGNRGVITRTVPSKSVKFFAYPRY